MEAVKSKLDRGAWEAARLIRATTRRIGVGGWAVMALIAVAVAAGQAERGLAERAAGLVAPPPQPAPLRLFEGGVQPEPEDDGRVRLQAFERHLLPHEDIPVALQDLLGLIEKEGLVALQGEYRPQPEPPGGFLRYHINLPVKGPAVAVQRFIQAALRTQKTLVLQSVQFKREHADSNDVEARIQWVLLTRLPEGQR